MTREEQITEEALTCLEPVSFMCGAKWADENPKEGMVSIDDVCNMLYAMLGTVELYDSKQCVGTLCFEEVEDFVEDFRKAMEE